MGELNDRLVGELIDAVRQVLRKESTDRLRDVYLIGDIEKDTARACIERLRELANESNSCYHDAQKAREDGLIDAIVAGELPEPKPVVVDMKDGSSERPEHLSVAAQEKPAQQTSVPQPTAGSRQSSVD